MPPTSFVIDGYVFYENSTACNNPTVKITNDNTGEEWLAESSTDFHYYKLTLKSTAEVMAGDTLRINASSPDGTQINVTMFEVTQADVLNGGVQINISLEQPKLNEIKITPQSAVVTVNTIKEFIATAYDQYGNPLEGVIIYWTSTNKTVGTVSPESAVTGPDGNATADFTALAPGNTTVIAGNQTDAGVWIKDLATVTVTPPAAPEPEIISWSPEESIVYNTEGESRRFNITVDQVVNVSWLINGTEVFSESGVNESEYTNTSAVSGLWSVLVIVENENGTDMHSWIWNVTSYVPTAPSITGYAPAETEVKDTEGATRTFNITVDQVVNVSWLINGTEVFSESGVNESEYTNTSAVSGLWSVLVIVENENGTAMHSWIWRVTPYVAPYAVELSVEPPVYVCVRPNENATFRIIVKNNGTEPDKFNLTVEAPGNVNAILSKKETSELDPGETENITLNVSSSQIGEYIVSVTATSQNDPSVSDTVITTTNVTEVPHRIVELVYNENNKGYNYIAWTGNYTINASDLVSMIRKGAGERAFPDDAFIAYFNTTSGDWEIFFGDGTGTTNFKLKQYDVVCVRVADEGKFYMPVP